MLISLGVSISLNFIFILLMIKFDVFKKAKDLTIKKLIKKIVFELAGIKFTDDDFNNFEDKIKNIEKVYEEKYEKDKDFIEKATIGAMKNSELLKAIQYYLKNKHITLKERMINLIAELLVNMYKR